jgi:hypothetical protein
MTTFLRIVFFPLLLLFAGIDGLVQWVMHFITWPKPKPKYPGGGVPQWVVDELQGNFRAQKQELKRQYDAELERRERIYQDQLKRTKRPR